MRKALLASLARAALVLASPAVAVGGGPGGSLLPCRSTGDLVQDQREVADVFEFVKGVCAQRGESCPTGTPLPTSCDSAECQRAVYLAEDSCRSAFAEDGFLRSAFKPVLDAAVAVCANVPHPADSQVRSREAPRLDPCCIIAEPCCSVLRSVTLLRAMGRSAKRSPLRRVMVVCSLTVWAEVATTRRPLARTSRWCRRSLGIWRSWSCARCG